MCTLPPAETVRDDFHLAAIRTRCLFPLGDRNRNWIIANCIGSRWKEFPRIGWILKENRNCAGMRRSTCDSGIAGRYIQLAVAVQVRDHDSGVKVKWWDAAAAGSAASTSSASAKGSDRHH